MKSYIVKKGVIYWIKAGDTVHLTEDQAKAFGSEYVEEIKTKPATKAEEKGETKEETTYDTKQVAKKKSKK